MRGQTGRKCARQQEQHVLHVVERIILPQKSKPVKESNAIDAKAPDTPSPPQEGETAIMNLGIYELMNLVVGLK